MFLCSHYYMPRVCFVVLCCVLWTLECLEAIDWLVISSIANSHASQTPELRGSGLPGIGPIRKTCGFPIHVGKKSYDVDSQLGWKLPHLLPP